VRLGRDVPVYVSDISEWRRAHAAELGGIPVDPGDPATAAPPDTDVAFDSTGKTVARRAALDVLGRRGALICVGHGETVTLDVSADLIAPERAVLGSEYFRYDEMAGNLELLRAHRAELARIITHTFPVGQIAEAFELFLRGHTGKVVVTQDAS
jgi:threonine 3-dehydrogenase